MSENKIFNNMISSALATAGAEIATIPICTIKTVYQTSNQTSSQQMTIRRTIQNIYRNHGLWGFCKSGFPAMSGQILTTMGKYSSYQYLNQNYPNNPKVVNGVLSGLAVSLLSQPFDWARITLQQNKRLISEFKSSGSAFFYRGYSKTFLKTFISSSFFYPLYDYIKNKYDNPHLASGLAALTATMFMHPFDYIKTRHIAGEKWFHGYSYYDMRPYYKGLNVNLLRVLPHSIITINLQQYYKGLSLNLLRVVPHFIITMNLIEFFNRQLN